MTKPEERREEARLDREECLFVRLISCADPRLEQLVLQGSTIDLSAGGLCLNASLAIMVGTRLELWVELAGHKAKYFLSGDVCWCRPDGGADAWMVGVVLRDAPGTDLSRWSLLFPASLTPEDLIH